MTGTLEALAALVLAFWIVLALDWKRWWPSGWTLESVPVLCGAPPDESVLVVIPARDEAEVLARTLPPLLEQAASFRRLVLVDDGSSDGTGDLARRLAAEALPSLHFEKVRVVKAPPLPPCWRGKLFALETGIRSAAGEPACRWLLFTDADILHPTGSVAALLRRASAGGHDLVSVMVRLRNDGFWEKLLMPPFVYFFQLMFPFRRASDPRSAVAAAAGGCILIRREILERIGGLESMRDAVIDDVTLARRVKDAGGRCWLGLDPRMVSLRGYGSLGEIARMVARSAFTQLRYSYALLAATLSLLGLFFSGPPVVLALAAASGAWLGAGSALAAWVLQALTLLPAVRHQRVPLAYALSLPFASLLYAYMTAYSAWQHVRGGPAWKGRPVGNAECGMRNE